MTLYTTGCPKCRVLKSKLDAAGMEYTTVTDVEEMQRLGLSSAPGLEVDGQILDFTGALKWLREEGDVGGCAGCNF